MRTSVSRRSVRRSGKRVSRASRRVSRRSRGTRKRLSSSRRGRGSLRRRTAKRSRGRRRGRGRGRGRRMRRVMRGGAIEYSPLPCYPQGTMLPDPNNPGQTYDASGHTNFDSTKQVGHETCVEYGTDGAENDKRFVDGMKKLGDMDITETIKDAVDAELLRRASAVNKLTRASIDVAGASDEEAARAARIAATRQAQQAAADAAAAAAS